MNKLMLSLGLATALLAQPALANTQWTVTHAETEFRLSSHPFTLVDEQGAYGQVGRQIEVRNIRGHLDPAFDATLNKTTESGVYSNGVPYSVDYYTLSTRYRFTYDVYDVNSSTVIAQEDMALEYAFNAATWLRDSSDPERVLVADQSFTALEDLKVFSSISYYPSRMGGHYFARFGEDFPGPSTIEFPYIVDTHGYWALEVAPDFYEGSLGLVHLPRTTLHITPVPEPETYALLLTGAIGLGLARRFGRKTAV